MFAWWGLAVLLGAIGTWAYYRWRARLGRETIARRRECIAFLLMRAVIALLLLCPVIANTGAPKWMTWASFTLPTWTRWLGFILGFLALPLESVSHD